MGLQMRKCLERPYSEKACLDVQYDTDAIGAIRYHDLMKDLLDEDSYALFCDRH